MPRRTKTDPLAQRDALIDDAGVNETGHREYFLWPVCFL